MKTRSPVPDPIAVATTIEAAPEPGRTRLRTLAEVVRNEAPGAIEHIAYGLATWHQGENLLHLGAFKNHVGIYPGAAAIAAFADELVGLKTSRGAIQVPHDAPLPSDLVRRITRWRVEQAASRGVKAESRRRTRPAQEREPSRKAVARSSTLADYLASQSEAHRLICTALGSHITAALPEAESKIWHGHPVWFLAGNPIVGYSVLKGCVRLLFWSGQTFDRTTLTPVGSFKAAEFRYTSCDDVDATVLRNWLDQARDIEWNYRDIVKNRGQLERLS